MAAAYQKELDFAISILKKMRIPVHLLHPGDTLQGLDGGLRGLAHLEEDYAALFRVAMQWNTARTVYKVMDQFLCHYIYFHLPAASPQTAVIIGPYLKSDPSHEMLLELAEGLGFPMSCVPVMEDLYASFPIYSDGSAIMAVVYALGEAIWKEDNAFDVVDINYEQSLPPRLSQPQDAPIEQADIIQQMKQLEERYAYENELMEIVSKGQITRADVMMISVSHLNYQQRLSDPLRNMKNYCIICNTLMRKAAQQGGVHPFHLDKMSAQYARSIENAASMDECTGLIGGMIRSYCQLVRTHATASYSYIVQKVIAYIESNLSGNLALPILARAIKASPGYLSALFHRETGHTLAEHINTLRMRTALQMMKNTQLQVQTVAQLTGFSDPNYFGKLFKRYYGVTPLQYRKSQHATRIATAPDAAGKEQP